jgi:MerR family mercuric resistance operon transcriptional regulator
MHLTVGKLAEAAGVGVETIRFYERRGLLQQPEKKGTGYREYKPDDVARIQFIKSAQAIGFTLKEIGELIQLETDHNSRCGDVQQRAQEKVQLVEQKITQLERMRAELNRLSQCCDSDQPLSECRLMACLSATC